MRFELNDRYIMYAYVANVSGHGRLLQRQDALQLVYVLDGELKGLHFAHSLASVTQRKNTLLKLVRRKVVVRVNIVNLSFIHDEILNLGFGIGDGPPKTSSLDPRGWRL